MFMPFDWGWFGFVYKKDILEKSSKSFEDLSKMSDDVKVVIQDPRTSTPGLGLLFGSENLYTVIMQLTIGESCNQKFLLLRKDGQKLMLFS